MQSTTLQSQPGLHTIENIICHDGTVASNTKRPKNTNRATQGRVLRRGYVLERRL